MVRSCMRVSRLVTGLTLERSRCSCRLGMQVHMGEGIRHHWLVVAVLSVQEEQVCELR